MGNVIWGVVTLCLLLTGAVPAMGKSRSDPREYGQVIMNAYSGRAGLAPVAFDHWLHRALFTCRLCHLNIGFSMEAGATDIKAADNQAGLYCGACHNGKMRHGAGTVFAACSAKPSPQDSKRCGRCHGGEKQESKDRDFTRFAEKLPKDGFGNRINWVKAEEEGSIKPVDFLEGVSSKRVVAKTQQDFSVQSKSSWMSDIKFSHEKHLSWLGCEICHPDIFMVRKGATPYTMFDISSGRYCGACHGMVAFPLKDCQRCHAKPVQPS